VAELIQRYQADFRRTIYFVDSSGLIRLHSNPSLSNRVSLREQPGIGVLAEPILGEERGAYTYEKAGETMLLTTRYLPELKWYLLVEVSEAAATAAIRRTLRMNLVISAVVILVTLLLTAYAINGFHKRLERVATTDALTGLGNRQLFNILVVKYLARFERDCHPLSMIVFDIDGFKDINDSRGHAVGDTVIRQIARAVMAETRTEDFLCRWGGDEFALLLPRCDADNAATIGEKLRQRVAETQVLPAEPDLRATISVGVTEAREGDTEAALFYRADAALYQAKTQGKNQVAVRIGANGRMR